jgi:hypothetical protein
MLADEVQVLLGSDVWFGHRSCPAFTYDPSMLGLLPYEWTDLLDDSPVVGVAVWHDGSRWWEVPIRAQATIVRANVYPNGSPRMLPALPPWWRDHDAVIDRLNNPS